MAGPDTVEAAEKPFRAEKAPVSGTSLPVPCPVESMDIIMQQ